MKIMPTWALQLLQTYGPGTFVTVIVVLAVFFLSRAWAGRTNADTRRDETFTSLTVKLDDERRQWQERYDTERRQWEEKHNHLQAEFTNFRISQAKKDGGLEVLQTMLTQEQNNRREFEKEVHLENQNLKNRVADLEQYKQQGLDRIKELEGERDGLMQKVAERDTRINLLENQVTELTNSRDTLNEIVAMQRKAAEEQKTAMNTTQPIPPMEDVDDTLVPAITNAAPVAAEETNHGPKSSAIS